MDTPCVSKNPETVSLALLHGLEPGNGDDARCCKDRVRNRRPVRHEALGLTNAGQGM